MYVIISCLASMSAGACIGFVVGLFCANLGEQQRDDDKEGA